MLGKGAKTGQDIPAYCPSRHHNRAQSITSLTLRHNRLCCIGQCSSAAYESSRLRKRDTEERASAVYLINKAASSDGKDGD